MKTALEKIKQIMDGRAMALTAINEVIKEHNQPFSPELITELFDGWEYNKELEFLQEPYQDVMIELYYYNNKGNDSVTISKDYEDHDAPMPRTLDEFIILIQQTTEIELKEVR